MSENKDNFCFQGMFFETFEEMVKYEKEWRNSLLLQETAERLLKYLMNDILVNLMIRDFLGYSNKEFVEYVDKIFEFSIKSLKDK
jgi:hypothetical protein